MIRLQCYEGLDESRALYEWNYKKQLLRIQADNSSDSWTEVHDDSLFDDFLLTRPLLEAISADDPVVLLIDEVDRLEVETEALLLEVLDSYQVTVPELGTMSAVTKPMVVLTSNNTRSCLRRSNGVACTCTFRTRRSSGKGRSSLPGYRSSQIN